MVRRSSFRFATLILPCLFHSNALAVQTNSVGSSASAAPSGLAVIDWLIIAAYACGTIWMGWYYSRQRTSTKEYFVGTGAMNPMLIGVSLFATLLSTLSYLSMPGEALGKGPTYTLSLLSLPFVFVVVGFLLLPVYMNQRVTSAYELLEDRLGIEIRILGALLFVMLRLVWMSLLIYMTSKAMTTILGVGDDQIPLIALVTGLVAVIYTSLGGLRAVVITDFCQTILLFGGALLVLATVTWQLGGVSWIPTEWNPAWDTQPIFSTDPSTRVTFVGTMLSFFCWFVATLGGDQVSVQRFMATVDAGAARRALATQLLVTVVVTITLGLVGFSLLGYFQAFPDRMPSHLSISENADLIFPYFIAFELPPVISGLVVSAIFAAAMSSIDSGVNSITAVVTTDLMVRRSEKVRPADRHAEAIVAGIGERHADSAADRDPFSPPVEPDESVRADRTDSDADRRHVITVRWMAFAIGAFVVVASSGMGSIPGNITSVTNKTVNLLTSPIFCLFFFALFVPFASRTGVIIGAIFGIATAVLIAFSGPFFGFVPGTDLDPISFQWISPAAIVVNIVTGCVGSLMFPRRPAAVD